MGAQGTTLLNFGAFPGASDAFVAVTGQTGIVAGSLVEAWLLPAATADHLADEHLVETLKIMAGNIIAGTGFTVQGINTSWLNEPLVQIRGPNTNNLTSVGTQIPAGQLYAAGGIGTRIYGTWNIAWVWN